MKRYRTLITILIILIVGAIMFISFFGINVKDENGNKKNIIPDYKMGMEFTDTRKITATVSDAIATQTIYDAEGNEVTTQEEGVEYTEENGYRIEEEKVNPDDTLTLDNYNQSLKVLREKLEGLRTPEYYISLNEENGQITIEIPEDDDADSTQEILQTPGLLIFFDTSTFETVFDSSYVKKSQVVTRQGDVEAAVFLQIELTDEGITKLQELCDTYKETTEQVTNEDGTTEEQTTTREVFIILNGMSLGTTVMENIVYDNTIMIPFAVSSDNNELNAGIDDAQIESVILDAGTTPLTYTFDNEVVESSITLEEVVYGVIGIFVVFLVLYVFQVIKFRAKGFISMYFQIGFLAVLLLIIRFTNVTLTMEGIAGVIIAVIINYIFNYIMLKRINEPNMYKSTNLAFLFYTIPAFIISIIFTFSVKANLTSFGMTMFWGIVMAYVYNFIFSKYVFENLSADK